MHDNDELDQLLDQALCRHAMPAPPDLQTRVIRHVQQSNKRRPLGFLLLGFAAATAALLLSIHPPVRRASPSAIQPSQLVTSAQIPAAQTLSAQLPGVQLEIPPISQRQPRRPKSKPLPKLDTFPAASPASNEERALLAIARTYPKKTAHLFAQFESSTDNPIHIEPVAIPPLLEAAPSGEKP